MSAADEIAKFHELLKAGAISEQEFADAKESILKGSPTAPSRGFAPQTMPIAGNAMNAGTRNQNGPSPLEIGASVAGGYVAGQFLKDKLFNNNDESTSAMEHMHISEGEVISADFVGLSNGDVYYEVSETVTYEGTLSESEIQEMNQEFDSGDSDGFFDIF